MVKRLFKVLTVITLLLLSRVSLGINNNYIPYYAKDTTFAGFTWRSILPYEKLTWPLDTNTIDTSISSDQFIHGMGSAVWQDNDMAYVGSDGFLHLKFEKRVNSYFDTLSIFSPNWLRNINIRQNIRANIANCVIRRDSCLDAFTTTSDSFYYYRSLKHQGGVNFYTRVNIQVCTDSVWFESHVSSIETRRYGKFRWEVDAPFAQINGFIHPGMWIYDTSNWRYAQNEVDSRIWTIFQFHSAVKLVVVSYLTRGLPIIHTIFADIF